MRDDCYKAIISDKLTLPIDEGLKKFVYSLMQFAVTCHNVDVYTSPENVGLEGVRIFASNKLMCNFEIYKILNSRCYKDIYYIPEASTTFASFIRLFFIFLLTFYKTNLHIVCSQKRYLKRWQKILLKLFKNKFHLITFSKSANIYYKNMGLSSDSYSLGVDYDVFRPVSKIVKEELRHKYGVNKDEKVVLHVGHIKENRNIMSLSQLVDDGWSVIIVGSTSMAYESNIADELKKQGVKIFSDYNPSIEEIYQISDVYVFPVINETEAIEFPLSVLEAMACGLPVVTTRFGALTECFEESDSFRFFTNKDDMNLVVNSVAYKDASNNRNLIVKHFSWNRIFEKMLM